jgi:hypothetical protein
MYVKGFMAAGKPYRESCTVRHSGKRISNRDNRNLRPVRESEVCGGLIFALAAKILQTISCR